MAASERINGRYEVLRRLGDGAGGVVLLVRDGHEAGARRALKVVAGMDEGQRERLTGEFRYLAALAHPCLVRVHDLDVVIAPAAGLDAGTPFFTADYIAGQDPAAALRAAADPVAALVTLAGDIAGALAHVHAAGLLHCDVKPANIVVRAEPDHALVAMLLDLGLSTARGVRGAARGTLAYMPPEALAGAPEPRSDLYALGATLHHAITGAPPFVAAEPRALVRAICEDEPAPVTAAWLPAELARCVTRLLARDPADRHSSARVLVQDLARIRAALGLERAREQDAPAALLPPRLVGRDAALATLTRAMAALAGSPRPRLVRVAGAPGAGRKAVTTAAIRAHQLAVAAGRAAPLTFLRGTAAEVAQSLGVEDLAAPAPAGDTEREDERALRGALLCWAEAVLARAADRAPAVLVLHGGGPGAAGDLAGEARGQALVRVAAAGHPVFARPLLVVASTLPAPPGEDAPDHAAHAVDHAVHEVDHAVHEVSVAPLSADETRAAAASMAGRPVDAAWAGALAQATGGLPRLVVEAVRTAAARAGIERLESVPVSELMGSAGDLADLVRARAALLPPRLAAVLEALAIHGGQARAHALAATLGREPADIYACVAALRGLGWVDAGPDAAELRLPSAAHAHALAQALPAARRVALHRAALAAGEASGAVDPVALARHLIETGPAARAVAACLDAARLLRARGERERALALGRHAAEHADAARAAEAWLTCARLATEAGHYEEAERAARQACALAAPRDARRARLVLARALQKRGALDAAEAELRALVAAPDAAGADAAGADAAGADAAGADAGRDLDPDLGDAARGAYARLLLARGRHDEAAAVAGLPDTAPPDVDALSPGRALRLESAGLAQLYQGNADGAEAAFARLERDARAAGDRALLGRALSLLGMVDHSRGHMARAAERYAEAGDHARAAGAVHEAAVYDLNQATAHMERGRFGAAARAASAARDQLARLGEVAELAAAEYNRGVALLMLGEVAAARRAAHAARASARTPQMAIHAELLDGDVSRREGDTGRARSAYERALAGARKSGSDRERLLALLNLAELLAQDRDARAAELLAQASACARTADDRDRVTLARGRVALCAGPDQRHDAPALIAALDELGARARAAGCRDQAWRAVLLAARLCHAKGRRGDAAARCESARARWDEIRAVTPEPHQDGLGRDPDAIALAALAAALDRERPARRPPAGDDSARGASEPQLRRLLALSRRLNSQRSLEPLLADVMDTAIELTAAERGFLLLQDRGADSAADALRVVVARNFDQTALDLDRDDARMSRSMAVRALRTGAAVLTVDAAGDDRFGAAESVAALRLRSVLAVPLRQGGRAIGTLYVDHRLRRGVFADQAVELAQELADIAAVAIENARLIEESRRQADEVTARNQALQAEVADREAELARARLSAGPRPGVRHDYVAIVGKSPALLAMLRVVDRAADTHLPVVIFGASGTGKELVARALHDNGPRRRGPFVPVNCGAVPGELLESELFGHVRGAFTGADRDRPGLFEVAHGGTLFLDEVADTSLAMQTKLLRVLQEGEIRRVGDVRARHVNVRVVAASNRRLEDLVARGRFREDLFWRLNVLRIDIPPLCERTEDIPILAQHVLRRLAAGRTPPKLTDAAIARLRAHAWPGNVRELENQLARALALGGEVIDAGDLDPRLAAAAPATPPGDLTLKPQVAALERRLIEEAMRRTGGNQTAAARLLGLSRYGLQKKLRRHGMTAPVS